MTKRDPILLSSSDDETVLDLEDAVAWPDETPVVGDDDQRAAALLLLLAEQVEDLVAPFAVEVAGRLVGQQDDGILDQGPRDRHPLLLAAGELGRLVAQPVPEPDLAQQVFGLGVASPVRRPSGMNGKSTLPTAVRLWIRLNCWKTKPSF